MFDKYCSTHPVKKLGYVTNWRVDTGLEKKIAENPFGWAPSHPAYQSNQYAATARQMDAMS